MLIRQSFCHQWAVRRNPCDRCQVLHLSLTHRKSTRGSQPMDLNPVPRWLKRGRLSLGRVVLTTAQP